MRTGFRSLVIPGVVCAQLLFGAGCGKQDDETQREPQESSAAPSEAAAIADAPAAAQDSAATADSLANDVGATGSTSGDDTEALAAMQLLASELGAKVPVLIKPTLRLDAVEQGPGTLMTWLYTNPEAASTALDAQAEYAARSSGIYENFCKPEKSLIRYGVTQHFVFRGNDGVEVTRVIVAPAECEAAFEAMLGRVAAALNEQMPITQDNVIRMDEVAAGPGRQITYYMTVIDRSAAEFGDADAAYSRFAPPIISQICATEGIDLFFSEDVLLTSVLSDKDGTDFAEVEITEEECAAAAAPAASGS